MKIKLLYILLFAVLIFTSACKRNDIIMDDDYTDESGEKNPFDMEQVEADGWQIDYSYSWGISNYDAGKCEIELSEDELVLECTYKNNGAQFRAGIAVFIDGIAQIYSAQGQEGYVVPITVAAGEEEETETMVKITLKPQCVLGGERHIMYMGSILEPEFRVKQVDNVYGHAMKMSVNKTWTLFYNAVGSEAEVSRESSIVPIDKSISDRYIYEEQDGKTTNKLKDRNLIVFEQDGKLLEYNEIDMTKKVFLKSIGGTIKKYRLCCMVNNEPYPAFDGCCYVDIETSCENMAQVEMSFLDKEIEPLSPMYIVLCPYSDDGVASFDFLPDKTDNYTLYNDSVLQQSAQGNIETGDDDIQQDEYNESGVAETDASSHVKNLTAYLDSNPCYGIKHIKENIVSCVLEKNGQSVLELFDYGTNEVLGKVTDGIDYNCRVDVAGDKTVVYGSDEFVVPGESSPVYVLDGNYKITDTINIPSEIYNNGCIVLPLDERILYVETFTGGEFVSCLKSVDYNFKQEKTIMKFDDKKMLFTPDCLKSAYDGRYIYCTGFMNDETGADGNNLKCIAAIDMKKRKYKVFAGAKAAMRIDGSGACFYDDNYKSDGKIIRIEGLKKIREIHIDENEVYKSDFSAGKSIIWTLYEEETKNEKITPRQIVHLYQTGNGQRIYEYVTKESIDDIFVFEEDRTICCLYLGDNGYEYKLLNY